MRYAADPNLAALSSEERSKFYDPATGDFDVYGARNLAYEKTRGNKMEDTKEVIGERARVSSEAQTKKAAEIDRRKVALKSGVADQEAFPNQEAAFLTAHPGFDPTISSTNPKKVQERANYLAAKEYEKNKLDSEIASALNYDTPEGYVNLAGKTEAAKKKRRALWDLAHEMAGNGSDAPAAQAPAAAAPTQPDSDIPEGTPSQDLDGQTFYFLNGKWVSPTGKKKVVESR